MTRGVVLTPKARRWECPSCPEQTETRDARVATPGHACPALGGLNVPFVLIHTNSGLRPGQARHLIQEREDYLGNDRVPMIDGRPVMAVRTERADGSNDTNVYAPVARTKAREVR